MDTFLLTTKNRQYNMDTFFQLEKNGFIFADHQKNGGDIIVLYKDNNQQPDDVWYLLTLSTFVLPPPLNSWGATEN